MSVKFILSFLFCLASLVAVNQALQCWEGDFEGQTFDQNNLEKCIFLEWGQWIKIPCKKVTCYWDGEMCGRGTCKMNEWANE